MPLNLTPESFVEIVVLGLYWQHWPPKLHHSPKGKPFYKTESSTVDHVLRTMEGIGVVTQPQIRMVRDRVLGTQHQRRLYRYCGVAYGSTYVTNEYSWMICLQGWSKGKAINFLKLVRDHRLEITVRGAAEAEKVEKKYDGLIYKSAYLAEVERVRAMFKSQAAHATANVIYRSRIAHELSEEG